MARVATHFATQPSFRLGFDIAIECILARSIFSLIN